MLILFQVKGSRRNLGVSSEKRKQLPEKRRQRQQKGKAEAEAEAGKKEGQDDVSDDEVEDEGGDNDAAASEKKAREELAKVNARAQSRRTVASRPLASKQRIFLIPRGIKVERVENLYFPGIEIVINQDVRHRPTGKVSGN